MPYINFDIDDDKIVTAADHIRAASRELRRCIEAIADVRIGAGRLEGRALDDHLQLLLEVEDDLSRAEGELCA